MLFQTGNLFLERGILSLQLLVLFLETLRHLLESDISFDLALFVGLNTSLEFGKLRLFALSKRALSSPIYMSKSDLWYVFRLGVKEVRIVPILYTTTFAITLNEDHCEKSWLEAGGGRRSRSRYHIPPEILWAGQAPSSVSYQA